MSYRQRLILLIPLILLLAAPPLGAAAAPELELIAAPELGGMAERLERYDRDALGRTVELVGLDEPGPPIPVHLVREGSGAARRSPSWGVAYATSGGQIVLIASRVPSYPYRQLETVLHHEVAHVLIDRAAAGRPVPRWFHEGLALYTAREWGLEDRSRLLWATLRRSGSTLDALDGNFAGSAVLARRAYAFSAAFVRFLIDRHGRRAPAEILAAVAAGAPFAEAFRQTTGASLAETEARFFRHLDLWNKWVPFVTSSTTLWMLISMLALWAFRRRRQRDAEIMARWDAEDTVWTGEEPNRWIH